MIKGIEKKYVILMIVLLTAAIIIVGDLLYKVYIVNNIYHVSLMTSSDKASGALSFDGGVFRGSSIKYGITIWKDAIPFIAQIKNGKEKVIRISPSSCAYRIDGVLGYFKISEKNIEHFKNLMNR